MTQQVVIKDGVLQCPNCQEEYLHQRDYNISFRAKEDGPAAVFVLTKTEEGAKSVQSMWSEAMLSAAGLEGRRDGCQVIFDCEHCSPPRIFVLCVRQHKGRTLMEWGIL